MGFKLLGLICLLVGIAACFGLWLHAIGNRSKTPEVAAAPAEPQPVPVPEAQLSQSMYSLAPTPKKRAGTALTSFENGAGANPDKELPNEVAQGTSAVEEVQDETASNHLELAQHFFNMADFEGTMEMCQLILDNQSASGLQISEAQDLMSRC